MRSLFGAKAFLPLFLVLAFFISTASGAIEYTVKKGDTLDSIAKAHHVSVKELKRTNKVADRRMKPGMKILIPAKSAAASSRKKAEVTRALAPEAAEKKQPERAVEPQKTTEKKAETVYHTVRRGDTLSSISREYSVTTAELKELNNLKRDRLRRGQRLLVKHIGPRTYTVKKGDNIWRIARKFDIEADALMTLNEMESPALKVGQKLYLEEPVDAATAETYKEAVGKNVEEEIRNLADSQEFKAQENPDKLATFARKMLNIPYRFGGTSILGIDCSAYVKKVYGLMGIELPRTAREQFKEGEKVDRDELSIGDLVFFRTYASFPSHVGIYLGNNLFIHASSRGKRVTIDSLDTPYYLKRFIGGKRVLTEGEKQPDQQG